MAMMTPPTQVPFGAITVHRIVSAVVALIETVSEWRAKRAAKRQLAGFSGRQLDDIGLTPRDIIRPAARGRRA